MPDVDDVNLAGPNDGTLPNLTTYWLKVTMPTDDGSSTATWPDRLSFYFKDTSANAIRTGYFNEYGELRARPAKASTVALRAMGFNGPGGSFDPLGQNVFEVTSHDQVVTYLGIEPRAATFAVPVNAPNISAKVLVLGLTDPIPAETPNGTVIVRKP